ncbi:MAG: hypothetical protein IT291_09570 [Deltaproteobacteria bacterium]|nr:hypothetical protein [Deltaproteobacteria bacterium]
MEKKTVYPEKRAGIIGDAIGIAHFVVANLIVLVGQLTSAFESISPQMGGLKFLYTYVDFPVYSMFSGMAERGRGEVFTALIAGEFIIVVSSILYGLIANIAVRLMYGLLK